METSGRSSASRLIFDRRYGWIYDEWKEPSEEALAGGRGMFCIFPIAKGVLDVASRNFNKAASLTKNVLGKPELLSPDALLASVGTWQPVSKVSHSLSMAWKRGINSVH